MTLTVFPFPVMNYACIFGLSQLVLSGVVAKDKCGWKELAVAHSAD